MKTQRELAAERDAVAKAAAAQPSPSATGTTAATKVTALVAGKPETWQPEVQFEGTLQPVREADLGFKVAGAAGADPRAPRRPRPRRRRRWRRSTPPKPKRRSKAARGAGARRRGAAGAGGRRGQAHDDAGRLGRGVAADAACRRASSARWRRRSSIRRARSWRSSQATLKNQTLAAPFSGSVTKVPSGAGAIVNPGTILFHVQDTSTVKLAGAIGEADAPLVKPGAPLEVAPRRAHACRARVVAVLSSVDAATRRVPLEAEIKNDGGQPLLGGSFVRAAVSGLDAVPVLRLPATALRPGSQNEVLVADGGRTRVRHIAFARAADGALLVRSGLEPNERVARGADGRSAPTAIRSSTAAK